MKPLEQIEAKKKELINLTQTNCSGEELTISIELEDKIRDVCDKLQGGH